VALRAAARLLGEHPGLEVVARSSAYETEPVGEVLDQPDFLNAVVRVTTDLSPRELVSVCKDVERRLGRTAGGRRHGPRPIDIDVLLVEGVEAADETARVPHPEMAGRRFVLAPLAELDPEVELPDGRSAGCALADLGKGQRVERVEPL
jgi:2-amino-4-hydroxy-6-hydroxymethyldihydropteridine diphosphokinase